MEHPVMPLQLHQNNLTSLSDQDIKGWLHILNTRVTAYTEKIQQLTKEQVRRDTIKKEVEKMDNLEKQTPSVKRLFAMMDEVNNRLASLERKRK